jgi:hypothetical protein
LYAFTVDPFAPNLIAFRRVSLNFERMEVATRLPVSIRSNPCRSAPLHTPRGEFCVSDLTVDERDLPPEVLTHPAAWAG